MSKTLWLYGHIHLDNIVSRLYQVLSNQLLPTDFKAYFRRGRRGRYRMVVGFPTTCAISVYQYQSYEFVSHSWRYVLDTTLCAKVFRDLRQVGGFLRVNTNFQGRSILLGGWDYGVERHFQQYISYIVTVSFIGRGNQSTRRKPPTCRKSRKTLAHSVVSSTYRHEWDTNS
jgi:hypothetical protein